MSMDISVFCDNCNGHNWDWSIGNTTINDCRTILPDEGLKAFSGKQARDCIGPIEHALGKFTHEEELAEAIDFLYDLLKYCRKHPNLIIHIDS